MSLGRRLDLLDQIRQRKPDPRNHHRPGLDAAMAIDALLERFTPEDVLEIHHARLVALTFNGDLPGRSREFPGMRQRVTLVEAELVKIVVTTDVIPRVELLV